MPNGNGPRPGSGRRIGPRVAGGRYSRPDPPPGPAVMTDPARSRPGRVRWLPTIVFLLAAVALMPQALAGQRTFAPIDVVAQASPYRDQAERPDVVNPVQNDVPEAQAVQASFWRDVRHGRFQLWSHATGAGVPTGALPFSALTAPLAVPYLVTPRWYAPGLRSFLTLLMAQWGLYLLARRLKLGIGPATVAGVAFAFSGASLIMLQRVGAVALGPWVILALLRIVERPTARRAAALAALVAWSWLEGFAAATLFTLYVGFAWTAWAMVDARPRAGRVPRWLAPRAVAMAAGGAVAGLLVAFQALPFSAVVRDSGLLDTRRFDGRFAMGPYTLFGQLDNAVIGGLKGPWVGTANSFEGVGMTGSVVLVGAVVALAMAARGRLRVHREAARLVPFLGLALVVMVVLCYSGGFLLDLAYGLPGMRSNTIYRHRWFIPLFASLLLAVTLDHLWRPRPDEQRVERPADVLDRITPPCWARRTAGVALAAGVVVVARAVPTFAEGLRSFDTTGPVARAFAAAIGIAALAALVAAAPRLAPRTSTTAASLALAVVVWLQLAVPMYSWIPMVRTDRYYSSAPLYEDLRSLAGTRWRFLGTGEYTPYLNSAAVEGLLDVRTTPVLDKGYRDLVASGLPTAFDADRLKTVVARADLDPSSPVLDQLGVRYLVLATNDLPLGDATDPVPADAWVAPADVVSLPPVSAPGGVAGVGVAVRLDPALGRAACTGFVRVGVQRDGQEIGAARRPAWDVEDLADGADLTVAVTGGESVSPEDELALDVRVEEGSCPALQVGTAAGAPAARVFTTPVDGSWRVVSTRQGWVYERSGALPLVRLDGGTVLTSQLVSNGVRATVNAETDTVVTVAQNDDPGWEVRVDGARVTPVTVDGALVGVPVTAGTHDIRLEYVPEGFRTGRALSALGLVGLAGLAWGGGAVARVRRGFRTTDDGDDEPDGDDDQPVK